MRQSRRSATMKDGDLFQIGPEPCEVRTCQECSKWQNKTTEQKTQEAVNNTELALVLVLQHQAQAHENTIITSNRLGSSKGATHHRNSRARALQPNTILRSHVNKKFPRSSHSICGISLVMFKNRQVQLLFTRNSFPRSDVWIQTS